MRSVEFGMRNLLEPKQPCYLAMNGPSSWDFVHNFLFSLQYLRAFLEFLIVVAFFDSKYDDVMA